MAYFTQIEIYKIGLKYVGYNVQICDKASIHNANEIQIGDNSRIGEFCVLSGKVSIDKNVHVAVHCNIAGGNEGVVLGKFSKLPFDI